MTEEYTIDKRAFFRAIWVFLKRDLRIWTYFGINFIINIVNIFSNLAIWGIIAIVAKWGVQPYLGPYGGDFLSYVILGVILSVFFETSLSATYNGTLDFFWSNMLEILILSPVNISTFILGTSLGSYVLTLMEMLVYTLFGVAFFGFNIGQTSNYGLASLSMMLGAIACTGYGLMAASLIFHIDARGGQDPIRWITMLLARLASGVYYPVSILPIWIQWLGCLVPHTYALDIARRLLLGGNITSQTLPIHYLFKINPLLTDYMALLTLSMVSLPLGWWMYDKGVRKARGDGRLSRWV